MADGEVADREVEALIKLLGDDERIAARAADALLDRRERSRAALRAAANHPDAAVSGRAHAVLEEIGWEDLHAEFLRLGRLPDGKLDLEAGLLAIARFGRPDLDAAGVRAHLDQLAAAVRHGERAAGGGAVLDPMTAPDAGLRRDPRLDTLVRCLFVELGLRGDRGNYYDPQNSYIDRVLARRLGIPISLTCVYLLVGRRAGAPVCGIGLPGHFLAGYEDPEGMRFIDVFAGGRLLPRAEIERLLLQQGLTWRPDFLAPVSDRQILVRCLNNLLGIFAGRGDTRRARYLARYRDALVPPPV